MPSQGAAPGLQDLVAGGVQIAPCSIPEARSLIDAGRVKSLAIMAGAQSAVPEHSDAEGGDRPRLDHGRVARHRRTQGLPEDIGQKLTAALKGYDSAEFKDFMNQRGFGMIYASGEQFGTFMAESNDSLGKVMKAVGIAR